MLRLCSAVLAFALLVAEVLPLSMELAVTKKVVLKGDLEDLITFGLLKEMSCDSRGNIFSPSNRKYGDAINAIVRFPHDASSYRKFSIDELPLLETGTITDFDLEPNGDLYVLARQVLKYSDLTVPIEFGENFILHFDEGGSLQSQVRLKLDTDHFSPTGLAVLKNRKYLIVGYRRAEGKTYIIAEIFQSNGNFTAKVELSRGGATTSNSGRMRSTRVYKPIAIKANGFVYVMRGTTSEPVYVLSATGRLNKTIQLKPEGLEFDSPKIARNDLIVSAHAPLSEDPETDINPQLRRFPVFGLDTGEIVDEYYWQEGSLGLACYTPGSLTFIGQDLTTDPSGWAIFEAKPTSPAQRNLPATGR
jgi:hypothetical protein